MPGAQWPDVDPVQPHSRAPAEQRLQFPRPRLRRRPGRAARAPAPRLPLRPPRGPHARRPGHAAKPGRHAPHRLPWRGRKRHPSLRGRGPDHAGAVDRTHRGAPRAGTARGPAGAHRGRDRGADVPDLPGLRARRRAGVRALLPPPARPAHAAGVPLHRRQGPHRLRGRAAAQRAGRFAQRHRAGLPAHQPPLRAQPAGGSARPGACDGRALERAARFSRRGLHHHRAGVRRPARYLESAMGLGPRELERLRAALLEA